MSEDLNTRKEVLIKYLNEKVKEQDWHAVSDAANDLRVLEARMAQETAAAAKVKIQFEPTYTFHYY